MNVNPTPREVFQSDKRLVEEHRNGIQSPWFQRSQVVALRHYARRITESKPPDAQSALTAFYKLQGAHEFVDMLIKLGEPSGTPDKPEEAGQLNYKA